MDWLEEPEPSDYDLVEDDMDANEKHCEMPPMFRFTWPGRDEDYICLEHAVQLRAVANAMGMYLQLIPVSGWKEQAKHQCNQIFEG